MWQENDLTFMITCFGGGRPYLPLKIARPAQCQHREWSLGQSQCGTELGALRLDLIADCEV